MAPKLKAPQVAHYGPLAPVPIPEAVRQKYTHLSELISRTFGVVQARWFQIEGALYQLMGQDAVLHAGTGLGKTLVAAAPYVLDDNQEKLTIIVSPLLALQLDMAKRFNARPETPAITINSAMKASELSQAIQDILQKKYRLLLISPESLLLQRIRDQLLMNRAFKKLILSIVIDEAHCISVWGSGFRKKYGTLHILRDYLPGVPILAMSATLCPRVLRDLTSKLHMGKSYGFINVGNERPELSLIIRRTQFPMSSFRDLTFLLKDNVYHPLDIPKTFIFIDNKTHAYHAIDTLCSYLPAHLQDLGIIRPFNARHGTQYRAEAMERFKKGDIRILVCTDAAGMGCDVPDVDITVQWRVTSMSNLIQRWGRTARGPECTGKVVLFVEPSAYTYNPTQPGAKELGKSESKSGSSRTRKSLKEPLLKGGFQSNVPGAQPDLRDDSPYEGTLVMVQTNGCHRKVWTDVFRNQPTMPRVKCCSAKTCAPELLGEIKPLSHTLNTQPTVRKAPKKGFPHKPTKIKLFAWRSRIWSQYHSHASWGAAGLLSDDLVEFLASIGTFKDFRTLEQYLLHRWGWWNQYGTDLAGLLIGLDIPYTPQPSKPRNPGKRKAAPQETEGGPIQSMDGASTSTGKKARYATATPKCELPPHPSSVAGGNCPPPASSEDEMSFCWAVDNYRHDTSSNLGLYEHLFYATR